MRSFISKAVITTMIAGAALAVSACTKTEVTNNTDMNVMDESSMNTTDTMTPVDGGAMNSAMPMNDSMMSSNESMPK